MVAVLKKQMMRNARNGQILRWWALGLALALAGCGGGGGSAPVNAVVPATTATHAEAAPSFTLTADDYGVQNATYLCATSAGEAMVLRAAIASSITDPAFRTTVRIDVDHPSQVGASATYSLGGTGIGTFPGTVYFFNGHTSSLLQTVGGTITFTSFGTKPGEVIAGSFNAVVKDGSDSAVSTYTIGATFSFTAESYGVITPAAAPIPASAAATYDANCASCHSLGSYDAAAGGAGELALKGGRLSGLLVPDAASHQGVRLAASQISALKVLLNAN